MTDSNVIEFDGVSKLDVPVEWLLEKAKSWGAKNVVIIAEAESGSVTFGSSTCDAHRINWLLDQAKRDLFSRFT